MMRRYAAVTSMEDASMERIVFPMLITLFVLLCVGIGAANIYTLNWCLDRGGYAETPFMTTICRLPAR
jgi:hypothetical protein